jgi:hypothetical protein
MTQATLLPEPTQYEKLVKAGVDMSWYDRSVAKRGLKKHGNGPVPLSDGRCCSLSIYLLKKNGSLWTVQDSGDSYKQVRDPAKQLPRDIYVCVCCKKQFKTIEAAKNHYGGSV